MEEKDKEQIEKELKDLEYSIKKLRILYEQFFMGFEKREPVLLREKVKRMIRESDLDKHKKAAVKFRFLNLVQTFSTLSNYWDRILRKIEQGTFDRTTFKGFKPRVVPAETRDKKKGEEQKGEKQEAKKASEIEEMVKKAVKEIKEAREVEKSVKRGISGSKENDEFASLYRRYVEAKKKEGISTVDLDYNKFKERMSKRKQKLKEMYNADFQFDVITRDNKVKIIAKKKK